METRLLGQTGVKVSRLAFGAMSFGGEANEDAARQLFERCLEAGINHFDTADVYNEGASERILGHLIKTADCREFFGFEQLLLYSAALELTNLCQIVKDGNDSSYLTGRIQNFTRCDLHR